MDIARVRDFWIEEAAEALQVAWQDGTKTTTPGPSLTKEGS